MHRLIPVVLCLLLLLPNFAQAQGGGAIDVALSNRDFSLLARAIDSADPFVRVILTGSQPVTLLAPTNTAFQNVANFLNIPLDDLLANEEVITQILLYHIIDGVVFSPSILLLDGQVVPTRLDGAFVGVTVNEEGAIILNRVAEVVRPDIPSSNGVVHGIDQVLLNRVITDTINSLGLEASLRAATPAPTETAEATSTEVEESTVSPDALTSAVRVRAIHLIEGAPNVDVYLGSVQIAADLGQGAISEYAAVPARVINAVVTPAGAQRSAAIVGPQSFDLRAQRFVTLAVLPGEDGTPAITLIEDDILSVTAEKARLYIFNGLPDAQSLNLVIGDTRYARLAYGSGITLDLPLSDLTGSISLVPAIAQEGVEEELLDSAILIDEAAFGLGSYSVAAVGGTAAAAAISIETLDSEIVTSLDDQSGFTTSELLASAPNNLIQLLNSSDDYSLMLQAVVSADASMVEALGSSSRQFTVFVPTNQAIRNLLSTINLSEQQFLGRQDLLTRIVSYHIVPEVILGAQLADRGGDTLPTLSPGRFIGLSVTNRGAIQLNNIVTIIRTDGVANNGVVHLVDNVLLSGPLLQELGLGN